MAEEFPAFYERTAPRLLARAVLLGGQRQDAEDAVQEAFLEAYRYWDRIAGYESPEGWVDRIMRQRLFARRKKWWGRADPAELEVPEPPGASPEETAEAVAVIRSLGRLPRRQRQVVVLHCLYGLSYQEVAETASISVGAVGSNLAKAREKLALWLAAAPEPEWPEDRLVAPGAGGPVRALVTDPLAARLVAAQAWLARGFAADHRTLARIREHLRCG